MGQEELNERFKRELSNSQNKLAQEQTFHQQTQNDLEKAQTENKNLQEQVDEYENEEEFFNTSENLKIELKQEHSDHHQTNDKEELESLNQSVNPENNQPSVLNNLFQKGKELVSQT